MRAAARLPVESLAADNPHVTRQLTDAEWALIQPRFIEAKASCHRDPRLRAIVDALIWVSENRASWYSLPSTYPPSSTCYGAYYRWRQIGVIQPIMALLDIAEPVPQPPGRKRNTTSASNE